MAHAQRCVNLLDAGRKGRASPAVARLSGEFLLIAEGELVGVGSVAFLAGMGRRRRVDGGEAAALEEKVADEFGETEDVQFGFGGLGRQAQQDTRRSNFRRRSAGTGRFRRSRRNSRL